MHIIAGSEHLRTLAQRLEPRAMLECFGGASCDQITLNPSRPERAAPLAPGSLNCKGWFATNRGTSRDAHAPPNAAATDS